MDWRARHLVNQWFININLDPWISRPVEVDPESARGKLITTGASDFQINAMRVVLSPIDLDRVMKCDDLMAKNVVPCSGRRRHSHSPAVVRFS